MGNERAIQQNVTPSVLDRDLEERLLASRLVMEIRNNPEQIFITLSGEGVMEFAQAIVSSTKECQDTAKPISTENIIIQVTDKSLISTKELINDLGMSANLLVSLKKKGLLTPVKCGGRVYYKREEIENLSKKPIYG